jgi:predicted amidohydrolase
MTAERSYPVTRPKVALIQTRWREEVEDNRERVLAMVDEAGGAGPLDLICLPEFFLGAPWYFPGRGHLKGVVDDTIPGRTIDSLAERAARYRCYILCGTIVEREGDRYFNTSVLVDPRGHIVGKARKIHRYSAEMLAVEAGEGQLLVETPFGRVGVCVCSDFWIQEMPRLLALRGAEITITPRAPGFAPERFLVHIYDKWRNFRWERAMTVLYDDRTPPYVAEYVRAAQ